MIFSKMPCIESTRNCSIDSSSRLPVLRCKMLSAQLICALNRFSRSLAAMYASWMLLSVTCSDDAVSSLSTLCPYVTMERVEEGCVSSMGVIEGMRLCVSSIWRRWTLLPWFACWGGHHVDCCRTKGNESTQDDHLMITSRPVKVYES